jgi:hypothetical protein
MGLNLGQPFQIVTCDIRAIEEVEAFCLCEGASLEDHCPQSFRCWRLNRIGVWFHEHRGIPQSPIMKPGPYKWSRVKPLCSNTQAFDLTQRVLDRFSSLTRKPNDHRHSYIESFILGEADGALNLFWSFSFPYPSGSVRVQVLSSEPKSLAAYLAQELQEVSIDSIGAHTIPHADFDA